MICLWVKLPPFAAPWSLPTLGRGVRVRLPTQSLGCFADEEGNRALQLYTAESCGAGETYMSPLASLTITNQNLRASASNDD